MKKSSCWAGYAAKGMKKKGNRMVPNCVPVSESVERINALVSEGFFDSLKRGARVFGRNALSLGKGALSLLPFVKNPGPPPAARRPKPVVPDVDTSKMTSFLASKTPLVRAKAIQKGRDILGKIGPRINDPDDKDAYVDYMTRLARHSAALTAADTAKDESPETLFKKEKTEKERARAEREASERAESVRLAREKVAREKADAERAAKEKADRKAEAEAAEKRREAETTKVTGGFGYDSTYYGDIANMIRESLNEGKLCPKGKAAAKSKFKVYPSAYANMYASAVCSGKVTPGGKKNKK
jgi:hypothetical protein